MSDVLPVRLDRWLWAARFFKTRALAAAAIDGGKIEINGDHPKRAKAVRVGDRLKIRIGPFEHLVVVAALSQRRGPARDAALLFDEEAEGKRLRERLAEQLRIAPTITFEGKGRPTKKDRRTIDRLRDGE